MYSLLKISIVLSILVSVSCLNLVSCAPYQPDTTAIKSFLQAKSAYEEEKLSEASLILEEVNNEYPDFHQAAFLRARVLYFQGDFLTAIRLLNKIVGDNPQHLESAIWLSRCYQAQNLLLESKTLLDKLIALNPEDTRILWLLALQSEQSGEMKNALAYLERAASGSVDVALVHMEMARIYFQWGQLEKANFENNHAIALLDVGSPLRATALQLAASLSTGEKK